MTNTNEGQLVQTQNGQVVTTSLLVAWKFKKEHRNVMASIREILAAENQAVKEWFIESEYTNERNQTHPMYIMNRDGFDLLVMGFTGKKAMQYKIEYIQEFNRREKEIERLSVSNDTILNLMKTDSDTLRMMLVHQERTYEIAKQHVEHEEKINQHEERLSKIEMLHDETHYSIIGWAQLHKIKGIDRDESARLGKIATSLSKEHGYEKHQIPDKRYGSIGVYHKAILERIFQDR